MPWETPVARMKAYEEFCRRLERLPDPLPQPVYNPPMTYFNNKKSYSSFVPYDLFYNFTEDFNPKTPREDRHYMPIHFENIFREEENKYIPVTTQLEYGRPLLLKNPLDNGERYPKAFATKGFYSLQGVNIAPDLESQPNHSLF